MSDNHTHPLPTRLADLPLLFDTRALESLPKATQIKIAQIDACLPQTQCGLCDHPDGCLPYARAIAVDDEPHNKCVPGGQPVTDAIAQIHFRKKSYHPEPELTAAEREQEQDDLRQRYHTHLRRVTKQLANSSNAKPVVSMVEAKLNNAASQALDISEQQAKNTIAAAKLRSKIKKLEKQLSVRPNAAKQSELSALQEELATL